MAGIAIGLYGSAALSPDCNGVVIAIAPDGQMAWGFNTSSMYRAKLIEGGELKIGIYGDGN